MLKPLFVGRARKGYKGILERLTGAQQVSLLTCGAVLDGPAAALPLLNRSYERPVSAHPSHPGAVRLTCTAPRSMSSRLPNDFSSLRGPQSAAELNSAAIAILVLLSLAMNG